MRHNTELVVAATTCDVNSRSRFLCDLCSEHPGGILEFSRDAE